MDDFRLAMEFISEWMLLLLPLFLLQFILWIAALVSVLRKNVSAVTKLPWILLITLVNIFGPIIYFVVGSGWLDKKAARNEGRE